MQIKMTEAFSANLILTIIFMFLSIMASIFNVSFLYVDYEWVGTSPYSSAFFFLVHNRWISYLALSLNGMTFAFAYKCFELLKKGKAFKLSNDSNFL